VTDAVVVVEDDTVAVIAVLRLLPSLLTVLLSVLHVAEAV
jgi:hypothetical protein